MGEVLGELLPVALGVAVSPVPVVAVILMLLAPHARAASVAFGLGWVLGISAVVIAVAVAVDPVDDAEDGDPSTLAAVLKILLGVLAVLLALRTWRGRPHPGEDPVMPGWMSALDTVTATKALGLGMLLSGANPKNLTLCLSAGVTIGTGALSAGKTVAAVLVFVALGSCTVVVPVIAYLVAQQRMQQPLDELRQWLTVHNAAVMTVLLLVIGVTILGQGVAAW